MFACGQSGRTAARWLIPVDRLVYLITDCDMDMRQPEQWAALHWDLIMEEKRKAFDDLLFPRSDRHNAGITLAGGNRRAEKLKDAAEDLRRFLSQKTQAEKEGSSRADG